MSIVRPTVEYASTPSLGILAALICTACGFLFENFHSQKCTFDRGMCKYHLESRNSLAWTEELISPNATFPKTDHSLNRTGQGHVLLLVGTDATKIGTTVNATSPLLSAPINYSVTARFWVQGIGTHPFLLQVFINGGTRYSSRPAYSHVISTSQWQEVCITDTAKTRGVSAVFHATYRGGGSVMPKLAIDDVTISTGAVCRATIRPIDGQWGSWSSENGRCSVSCGRGLQLYHRLCNSPPPSLGGHNCLGSATKYDLCNQSSTACRVDGHWSSWSSYSQCAQTCGSTYRASHRYCTNPAPSYGGHKCAGSSIRTITCRLNPCHSVHIVNGAWSTWTTWSKCTTSCDMGVVTRHRSCNHPAPSGGGHNCVGISKDTHDCSLGPCPSWTHWYVGTCSVSCGNGTMERVRQCTTGTNSDCTGSSYELVACTGKECI